MSQISYYAFRTLWYFYKKHHQINSVAHWARVCFNGDLEEMAKASGVSESELAAIIEGMAFLTSTTGDCIAAACKIPSGWVWHPGGGCTPVYYFDPNLE